MTICKAGDLAMIVRNTEGLTCIANLLGSPVTVESAWESPFGHGTLWRIKTALRCPHCLTRIQSLYDRDLQPLRPPENFVETVRDIVEGVTA